MASITYLRLDSSYDPVFNPAVALTDLAAVTQAIQTALLLFQGEWWESLNVGTPMFQVILGRRATPKGLQAMSLALSLAIQAVPYVSSVVATAMFNPKTRQFSYSATAQTSFGPTTVSGNLPGNSASI